MSLANKHILLILMLLGCNQLIFSQVDSAYLEFVMRSEKEYQEFTDNALREYKQFEAEYNKNLKLYNERIYKIWGKDARHKKEKEELYTEYADDLKSRMSVDFKSGDVTIEVIVDKDSVSKSAVKEHLRTKGKHVSSISKTEKISEQDLLKHQIDSIEDKKTKSIIETVIGEDGKKRKVAKLELKLAPGHIKKRAEIYLPLVHKYSKKYDLNPELVLAIMHTESYFNPKAHSCAAACGLLQLIPEYGGRAAYRYVKGVDKIPKPAYLYIPENNIELGCAYIHILNTRVFGKIKDERSKLYCLIASYNCGAGRLSQVFVKTKNVHLASKVINKKSHKQVYKTLITKLPGETKRYLPLVLNRTKKYRQWLKN